MTTLAPGPRFGRSPRLGGPSRRLWWTLASLLLLVPLLWLLFALSLPPAAMLAFLLDFIVGTLAFWLSTVTDAPLAAVGGAVFTMFVFAILDQVEQLGSIRDFFPTAEEFAWTDLLQTPVDSGDLFRGVVQSLVYAAVFTALGFRHFSRRDVTS